MILHYMLFAIALHDHYMFFTWNLHNITWSFNLLHVLHCISRMNIFFTCFLHSLHALSTYFTWLLHVLHDYYMNFSHFLLTAKKWHLSFLFSASLINIHEDTRSRPSTWMVAAFYPVLGVESTWDEKRRNSNGGCRAFYAQGHQRKRPGLSWHREVYAGVRKPPPPRSAGPGPVLLNIPSAEHLRCALRSTRPLWGLGALQCLGAPQLSHVNFM